MMGLVARLAVQAVRAGLGRSQGRGGRPGEVRPSARPAYGLRLALSRRDGCGQRDRPARPAMGLPRCRRDPPRPGGEPPSAGEDHLRHPALGRHVLVLAGPRSGGGLPRADWTMSATCSSVGSLRLGVSAGRAVALEGGTTGRCAAGLDGDRPAPAAAAVARGASVHPEVDVDPIGVGAATQRLW